MIFNLQNYKIFNQIVRNRHIVLSLAAFTAFLFFTAKTLSGINPLTEEVPNYKELISNPYENYEKLIKRASVKKIIDSKQFAELKYDNSFLEMKDLKLERRENIFSEEF